MKLTATLEENQPVPTIVVATACSVLGVLLLVMVVMVFRRRKPHPPRLCRPSSVPPPYSRVHSNSLDEHDRMLLIGYDNTQITLPSYEEATRRGNMGEYRPLPSIPSNFRSSQLPHRDTTSRHSIITTSTMNRDGISEREVFGSIDTVNYRCYHRVNGQCLLPLFQHVEEGQCRQYQLLQRESRDGR
ncbi:hypothetical protein DPMN_093480 [Dreissena polymorpha]|uniref:Uncharacterized protein n=1 Tax=Dreissena polymorpha TaxID=45954 RepID=A0A9D4L3E2_DREPO|nr:hypothetical protein DPMN_093480 [Dreissena polymorpha]